MVTSAYSKSSNYFTEIPSYLAEFREIIYEIIISKIVGGIVLIFCISRFINNSTVKKREIETVKLSKVKYLEIDLLSKISQIHFEDPICTGNLEETLFKYFLRTWNFS